VLAALGVSLGAALLSLRATLRPVTAVLVAVIGSSLVWQSLLCAFTVIPPARSARDLVRAVRPFITPGLPLYSVGQYR
jgi:hypothetical protein